MRRGLIWLVIVSFGVLAVGCASSSGKQSTGNSNGGVTAPTTMKSAGAMPSGPSVTVNVSGGDYFFHSSLTTFKVGVPYHFVVTNTGKVAHEMMIVQPIPAGTMGMEEMDKMAMAHIEKNDLPRGATATLDVTFDKPAPPGTLELACHVQKHYQKGQRLPIVVEPA